MMFLYYIYRKKITKSDAAKDKETFRCILHYNKKKTDKNIVQKFVQKNKKKTCIIKNHRIY